MYGCSSFNLVATNKAPRRMERELEVCTKSRGKRWCLLLLGLETKRKSSRASRRRKDGVKLGNKGMKEWKVNREKEASLRYQRRRPDNSLKRWLLNQRGEEADHQDRGRLEGL